MGRGTDIGGATEYLEQDARRTRRSSFSSPISSATNIERPLKLLAQRHDVVAVTRRGSERARAARHRPRAIRRSGDGRDARRRHERPEGARAVRHAGDRRSRRAPASAAASGDRRDPGDDRQRIMEPLLRFFRTRETEDSQMSTCSSVAASLRLGRIGTSARASRPRAQRFRSRRA